MIIRNPDHHCDIEKAIKYLVFTIEKSGHNPKPVIFHSIRVGLHLYNLGYDKDIVIAALLHDLLEDSDASIKEIRQEFGNKVACLVQANTFDKSITDKNKRDTEAIDRCVKEGREAAIIKAADIIDNSNFYYLAPVEIQPLLFEKMKYFIKISSKIIKNEPIWRRLNKHYTELTNKL